MIVAKVFPGPVRDTRERQGVRPDRAARHARVRHRGGRRGHDRARGPRPSRRLTNLSGVAPKAWIGNYRVFTIPTPLGHEADTPEIVQAFEAAVADGMNVINFSGGGPQTDPANDAMVETVHNTRSPASCR